MISIPVIERTTRPGELYYCQLLGTRRIPHPRLIPLRPSPDVSPTSQLAPNNRKWCSPFESIWSWSTTWSDSGPSHIQTLATVSPDGTLRGTLQGSRR